MKSAGSTNVLVVLAVGSMVVLAVYFLWHVSVYYLQIKRGEVVNLPQFSTQSPTTASSDSQTVYDVATADDPSFGPPQAQAKVTIVEFVDYQCPYCQEASSIVRSLSLKYQASVRFIIRDFPLSQIHPDALAAAEAAGCAEEQSKFWPMYDRLFAQNGTLARANLDQAALAAGLDSKAFDQCLDSHRRLTEIRADQADGTKAGVVGTPTFFINGRRAEGVIPQDTFEQLINAALGA